MRKLRVGNIKRAVLFALAVTCFCETLSPDSGRLLIFKKQSALLLAEIPSYTCLESMGKSAIDPAGRVIDIDLLRIDVAISGTKEMYGWTNSRKFSDRSLASILSNGFNTAGIFSNLAEGLAAMDLPRIEFIGDESLGDERVYRYGFHASADAASWQIQSHSQNGTCLDMAYQ